jgi:hypothetical protein
MVGPASEFNFMQTARNCSLILDNFQKINGNQETASGQERGTEREPGPPCSPQVFRYFPPAVAKVYIVSFRTLDDRRPSKFIVLADNMRCAITMTWEHGGADFQSRFDKSTAQAQEMKEGALGIL